MSQGMKIQLKFEGLCFHATLEENNTSKALAEILRIGDLTVTLEEYGGFEKVGDLGTRLPSADRQMRTQPGDIMLYASHSMVIFHGSNSWAYTRLGKIDDVSSFLNALPPGDVVVTLSLI